MPTRCSHGRYPVLGSPELHRLARTDARRKSKKRPKVPRSGIPQIDMNGPERDYFVELKEVTDRTKEVIERGMLDGLEVRFPSPDAEPFERTRAIQEIGKTFDLLEERVRSLETLARSKAVGAGDKAQLVHRSQQERQLSAVGIDVFRDTPELGGIVEAFARVNTRLIQSIPRDELRRVETILVDGVRQGRRHESVAKDIQSEFGIAERRAQLIARDQMGKIAADLSRSRMESNGVRRGVWRTMGDERVRDQHAARDGRPFDLSSGIQGERPGEPINCRCYTEPFV